MAPHRIARRSFLLAAGVGAAASALPATAAAARLRIEQTGAEGISIGCHFTGPETGRPVVLLHDAAYDIHSYAAVARLLAARGMRVLLPCMRGHGSTRLYAGAAPPGGSPQALAGDVLALMDALHIPEAVLAGVGWGTDAAYAFAALKPRRCIGIVAVDGWQTDTALPLLAGVTQRGNIARLIWQRNSPAARIDEALFQRSAPSLQNPDFAAVITDGFRHRLARESARPEIAAPTITLAGSASGVPPRSAPNRTIDRAGYNLPHEAPLAFADAVTELVLSGKWRS